MAESRVIPSFYPENSMVALVLKVKVKVIPMSFRKSRARKWQHTWAHSTDM